MIVHILDYFTLTWSGSGLATLVPFRLCTYTLQYVFLAFDELLTIVMFFYKHRLAPYWHDFLKKLICKFKIDGLLLIWVQQVLYIYADVWCVSV